MWSYWAAKRGNWGRGYSMTSSHEAAVSWRTTLLHGPIIELVRNFSTKWRSQKITMCQNETFLRKDFSGAGWNFWWWPQNKTHSRRATSSLSKVLTCNVGDAGSSLNQAEQGLEPGSTHSKWVPYPLVYWLFSLFLVPPSKKCQKASGSSQSRTWKFSNLKNFHRMGK